MRMGGLIEMSQYLVADVGIIDVEPSCFVTKILVGFRSQFYPVILFSVQ